MAELTVVKIGGAAIEDAASFERFTKGFAALEGPKILVHGGGKAANRIGEQLGIESRMEGGRRITDDATLDLVTMVYGGAVNKKVVVALRQLGLNPIGVTGADAGILEATRRPVKDGLDMGWVGDITNVRSTILHHWLQDGITPVIAPLTYSPEDGKMLNTNADGIAGHVAVAMQQHYDVTLLYCFDREGVMIGDEVLDELSEAQANRYREDGSIGEGMLPKLHNAFFAAREGVANVILCHSDRVGEAKGTHILSSDEPFTA